MSPDPEITTIAHVIQLAIAPVFLLTGIGSLLAVMAHRLGRIIDRAGFVEGRWSTLGDAERREVHVATHTLRIGCRPAPASQIGHATAGNNLTRYWKIARGRSR